MNKLSLIERIGVLFRGNFQSPSDWVKKYFYGDTDDVAGVDVSDESAMRIIAVYACVRILSETIASLPVILYRRLERGKERATEHPAYDLLHRAPNKEMNAFQFKELLQAHLGMYGNAYAQIERGKGSGFVTALWPMRPDRVKRVERIGGRKVFTYLQNGTDEVKLPQEDVLHIPGFGYDGLMGYSPIDVARRGIAIAIAAEKYGANFFGNDARPGGYIAMPNRLKDEKALERMRLSWNISHQGVGQSSKIAILEDGAEFKTMALPPEHAQFLETRRFQINEIARLFRIPPHLLQDLDRATFSNIEHQSIEFVVHTIRPWLVRWEQAIANQLLSPDDQGEYFYEFLVDALLRGDVVARWTSYRTAREIGVLSANDIRELENMNPIDGGDEYMVPMNWIPQEQAGMMMQEPTQIDTDTDDVAEPEENSVRERRALRSATARSRLSNAYEKIFADVISRIVRAETRSIRKEGFEKLRTRDEQTFEDWLATYYDGLPEYIRKVVQPTYRSLAEAIKGEISDEINVADGIDAKDEQFIGAYVTQFISRYINKSKADLERAKQRAYEQNRELETVYEEQLANWEEHRPATTSLNETVRGSNAFAKNIYLLAGITLLRWVAMGAETCPFCEKMNGRIVGINEFFEVDGDTVKSAGADMEVKSSIGHPPLHRGCVCQIVAS